MHRRQYEADWERRKQYLIRYKFAEASVLSPIPEHPEPPSAHRRISPEFSGPLPELIIEKPTRKRYYYEDETEEFYNRLEVKMKRLYRKLFLGEDIDISSNEQDQHESYVTEEISEEDNYEVVDNTEAGYESERHHINEEKHNRSSSQGTEDETKQKATNSERQEEDSEKIVSAETSKDSEHSARFAEIEGKDRNSASTSSSSQSETNEVEEISQTFTDQPCQYNNSGQDESSDSMPIQASFETVLAQVHADGNREPEIMRRQECFYFEDSLPSLKCKDLEKSGLNITRLTMEQLSGSTDNVTAPMELESVDHTPYLRPSSPSTPLQEDVSPIFAFKRVSQSMLPDAKRKKFDNGSDTITDNEIGVQVKPNVEHVAIQTIIRKITENKEAQTDVNTERNRDIGIQVDTGLDFPNNNDVGTQTETQENRDAWTQTSNELFFENFYVMGGITLYEINYFF